MTSPSGRMEIDKSPGLRSNHSSDTLRSKRSRRSPSPRRSHSHRDRDRERDRDRDRDRRSEEHSHRRRDRDHHHSSSRRSRSPHERSHRDRDHSEREHGRDRDRERDRDKDRDRERERDRDRDRDRDGHRDRERRHRHERERERDKDRESNYSDSRRRKRDGEPDDYEDSKRPKHGDSGEGANGDAPMLSERISDDRPNGGGQRYEDRPPREEPRRRSPTYTQPPAPQEDFNPDEPREDDSEARSVFVSQLAARLTARDLGYFFEDKLGDNTVMDSRIVTDRLSRRSKGIGYVEFRNIDLVEKAINLSGTVVMGLPIKVQLTESERNKLHPGDGNLNLPPGVSAPHGGQMQLYVGSLHFNLTESDIRQVFEPFGDLEFVDLHRDPATGRSKGYAFVQYKRGEDAKMALDQMEGFELAGRQLKVNTVHEKGTVKYTTTESLDDSGGGNLNAASRQALMQKLARTNEPAFSIPQAAPRPNIPQQNIKSRSVLLKNMFDVEEETEKDWDKELAADVKQECSDKYGSVTSIKVEKDSQGEIYVKFDTIETAQKAIQGLNGRWFGGRQVSAQNISDAIMQAHQ